MHGVVMFLKLLFSGKRDNGGMTLVEVVIAMLLVTMLVGGIYQGITQSVVVNYSVAQRVAAFSLCKDALEQMRGVRFADISDDVMDIFGENPIRMTHLGGSAMVPLFATPSITITDETDPVRKEVEISVSWEYRGRGYTESIRGVLLYKDDPSTGKNMLSGTININPNNSPQAHFVLTLLDDSEIDRNDLHQDFGGYSGMAKAVHVMPKGAGNQNGLTLNSVPYPLDNGRVYDISSNNMQVNLYNDNIDENNGKAMGKWWIQILALDAVIQESNPGGGPPGGGPPGGGPPGGGPPGGGPPGG